MTAKVLMWNGITTRDLPADRILESAVGQLESVIVVGYDKDGNFYGASSFADGGDALWLLENCKLRLLQCGGLLPGVTYDE